MSADNTPETNAADGTGDAAAARPFLRIVKGNPSDAEIAAVVINMNVWTRLKLAQGATPSLASKESP